MIKLTSVKKNFGHIEVLKDISIEINEGEIYGLIGHSGAGKSTLLRCINGLESYDDGSVNVMGKEIKNLNKNELRAFRKDLGMIFQGFNLLKRKTVFENISLPLEVWGYKKDFIKNRVDELLELVGLTDKAKNKPDELSGGQKQRVAIARALAKNPKILLCDEPTGALDYQTGKAVLKLLQDTCIKHGVTVVVITHNLALTPMGNKVIRVKNGVISDVTVNENPVPIDEIEW